MNTQAISLTGATLFPLPSGGLHWPDADLLCISDLHLGKSDRIARRRGTLLPPYETRDTLARIETDLARTRARHVLCLGDSFDDLAAAQSLDEEELLWLARLQAGRRWTWIEGNHDPGAVDLGGTHRSEYTEGPLTFRHIARGEAAGEISGHYHPKAELSVRGRRISRACFLYDTARLILPAYGTYTGGLRWTAPVLRDLFGDKAMAALVGDPVHIVPMPRE
ncbi:MAG: ligase-associated DNA damage response endonuclease PdeM [Alphaproteobacteria bacterium]|nr:ligase-associated DNA damage response endonuclease PdeM [Alphaproteobacteria bacterium]